MSDAKAYRRLRELLKAKLWAQRVGTPDEYLAEITTPLPAGYKTPEALAQYENYIPAPVRRAAALADDLARNVGAIPGPNSTRLAGGFITAAPDPRPRKHRVSVTGKPRGRPSNGDVGLARAVYVLMEQRGIGQAAAIAEIAWWLVKIGGPHGLKFKAARDRVYKALSH
jgi:hypothetical protein